MLSPYFSKIKIKSLSHGIYMFDINFKFKVTSIFKFINDE